MEKTNKSLAFTLAETLVVIGLIGIVSALTLPNLNKNTGDMEQVARVKKQQQVLTEAYGRARAKYGTNLKAWLDLDSNNTDRSTRVAERFKENMTIKKSCGLAQNSGCFASSNVLNLNGSAYSSSIDSESSSYKFVANDGTSYAFSCSVPSASGLRPVGFLTRSGCVITIDVDGPNKGSNTIGKDIFKFSITGKSPQIFTSSLSTSLIVGSQTDCQSGDAFVCTSYIIENGNTDYPVLKDGSFILGNGGTWLNPGIGNTCSVSVCPAN